MKKILSLVLALLMSASVATVGLAAGTTDTAIAAAPSAADTYGEAIAVLENYGIMKGINPDTFDADADSDIQRYQMALFTGRIATGWVYDTQWTNGGVNNSGFTDLDGTPAASFYGAISYAAQKGIILGYGDGKFGPTDGIKYKDALTMVLRTLEYTGLNYPWGFIEKAESLGLTKGITGVAYDDILNRGEVAQIIYNALFVTTKNTGDTLGARNFGGNLGWKTIIVSATDRAVVDPADKEIPGKIPSGAVAFRVVAADGTLEENTYYIARKYLGIGDGAHDDEAVLGAAYSALFTTDADGLVRSLVAKPLFVKNVKNYGLPTKDADGKYPIEKALEGLTLVSKFGKDNYVNAHSWNSGEIIIKNALGTDAKLTKGDHKYAIDWKTGDILVVDKDGEIEVTFGEGDDANVVKYSVAWYYNALLEKYFQIKTAKVTGGDVEVVGINILDDISELGDLMTKDTLSGGLTVLNKDTIKKATAYANLDLYSLAGTTTADYGLYTRYALGLYKTEAEVGPNKKAGFSITTLDATAKAAWEAYSGDPFEAAPTYKVMWEGVDDKRSDDIAYLTGEAVESGDYVIYAYNEVTGELNIFKNITKTNDKDNFVGTGIVRAYNLTKKTVTIGDREFSFDYDELLGNGMKLNADKPLSRAAYGKLLGDSFMNFVNYVVCDNRLVWISGNATNDTKYIIVDSYAGISADGYVVVNGYASDALKYTQFRIGAYDQWLKGDLYNYALNYDVDSLFTKGSVYAVTSYDKANDAYYVKTVAIADANTVVGGVEYIGYKGLTNTEAYEVEFDGNGYKHETIGGEDKGWKRASADDKYVFLLQKPADDEDFGYAPIVVYTGKGDISWFAKGERLKGTNIIIVADDGIKGFQNNQYAVYYGLVVSKNYDSASYTSAYEASGKQLLGAYNSKVDVINLYTGAPATVTAVNKTVAVGSIYPVINGQITDDGSKSAFGEQYGAYGVTDLDAGKLLYNAKKTSFRYLSDTFSADYFDKEKFSKYAELQFKLYKDKDGNYVGYKDGLNGGVKVMLVSISGEKIYVVDDNFTSDDYKAWVKKNDVKSCEFTSVLYHLGKDDGSAVIYILDNPSKNDTTDDASTAITGTELVLKTDEYDKDVILTGSVDATITKNGDTGLVTDLDITAITLTYGGDSKIVDDSSNHKYYIDDGFYFGTAVECDNAVLDIKYSVDGGTDLTVYDRITAKPYADHTAGGSDKKNLKSITIPVAVSATGLKAGDTGDIVLNIKDSEGKTSEITITYTVSADGKSVAFTFATNDQNVRGVDYTYNAEVKDADGKVITPAEYTKA
jgi:hypothetical protein